MKEIQSTIVELSSLELSELDRQMPLVQGLLELELSEYTEKHGYVHIAFSVFDHWLLRDEMHLIFNLEGQTLKAYRAKFLKLVMSLSQIKPIYTWTIVPRDEEMSLQKFLSAEALVEYAAIDSMNENGGDNLRFILPNHQVIIQTNFDWTGTIIYHPKNREANAILKLVEEAELYLLQR